MQIQSQEIAEKLWQNKLMGIAYEQIHVDYFKSEQLN